MNPEQQRPPLWEVIEASDTFMPLRGLLVRRRLIAALILALRDWLVPEETPPLGPAGTQNMHIRALLTSEADRAERGYD